MIRKIRFAVVAGMMVVATSYPATAQDMTPFEECVIQCRQWYPGNYYMFQLCYQWCSETYGGPQAAPDAPLGKLD